MKVHAMLDLETAAKTPDSMILQIGCVAFNEHGYLDLEGGFRKYVQFTGNMGEVDPRTIEWHANQPHWSALSEGFMSAASPTMHEALAMFQSWFRTVQPETIWSFGATFDIPIMEMAYKRCKMEVPWSYKQARCYRTLQAMRGGRPKGDFVGNEHDAFDDAVNQVRSLWALEHAPTCLR